ncbi:MAG: 30S ribosomal protein S24e [Thermoplasmata archaeon]|nr:30S ribosomal protein S24e [Thermoplasmata archaeon]
MEIEIISKKENVLLGRTEIKFKVLHDKSGTPKREEVRGKLAEVLSVSKDTLVVDTLKPKYGTNQTMGYAKAYKNKEALELEREPVLVRNKLKEKKKKEGTQQQAAPKQG